MAIIRQPASEVAKLAAHATTKSQHFARAIAMLQPLVFLCCQACQLWQAWPNDGDTTSKHSQLMADADSWNCTGVLLQHVMAAMPPGGNDNNNCYHGTVSQNSGHHRQYQGLRP